MTEVTWASEVDYEELRVIMRILELSRAGIIRAPQFGLPFTPELSRMAFDLEALD